MGDMERAKEIAGKLSDGQRYALTSEMIQVLGVHELVWIRSATTRAALRRGLVVDRMYSQSLTPLGLAVRRILEDQNGNG